MPDYKFKTIKKPDGSLGYYVNGTELQDKAAYDRIQQKVNQTADQDMQDAESKFDAANTSSGGASAPSELDSMFSKAKGGKVKKSSSPKKKLHPNW
jgi:hypothetical protein